MKKEELIALREKLGLSQLEIANLTGYSLSQISKFEQGLRNVSKKFVKILNEKLNLREKVIAQNPQNQPTTSTLPQSATVAELMRQSREIVVDNNEKLDVVVDELQSVRDAMSTLHGLETVLARTTRDIIDGQTRVLMQAYQQQITKCAFDVVKEANEAQTRSLVAFYKQHINSHACVIQASLCCIAKLIERDQNKTDILEMIKDIMAKVNDMVVK